MAPRPKEPQPHWQPALHALKRPAEEKAWLPCNNRLYHKIHKKIENMQPLYFDCLNDDLCSEWCRYEFALCSAFAMLGGWHL
jgi:hypothetical protein